MTRFLSRSFAALLASLTLATSLSVLPAGAQAPTEPCPLIGDADLTGVVGQAVQVMPFGVNLNGSNTECLFGGGDLILLVRRQASFFAPDDTTPLTPDRSDALRALLRDEITYTPVEGMGDSAVMGVAADPALVQERMAVLIVRRGPDAFIMGVMGSPDRSATARAMATAVMAR